MRTIAVAVGVLVASAAHAQTPAASWLDRPLTNWNAAARAIPSVPAAEEAVASVIARCTLKPPRSTTGETALAAAGWIPFWNFDRQLVAGGVEVLGGMRSADGMCRPLDYNLFVFVDGRFAGTLAPAAMSSRLDASSGAVRLPPSGITAEFARYTTADALCCPSSRVTVRYRIDRTPAGPVVVPTEIRNTRP